MCGIIASLGDDSVNVLYNGLTQLQNRGYDSAGISTINNDIIKTSKFASDSISGLSKLKEELKNHQNCNIGIGHTRWATHGEKTDINSHPHQSYDNKFTLVHNGIIENFLEIKQFLQKKGIIFKSSTDTEAIVHLLAYNYSNEKGDNMLKIRNAIKKTINNLTGTWGIVIMCTDTPNSIFCTRQGSPILIGNNANRAIITSEQSGFSNLISNYFVLENNDICNISLVCNKIKLHTDYNQYEYKHTSGIIEKLTPDPYPHWTLKEIYEQTISSDNALCGFARIKNDYEVKLGGFINMKQKLSNIDNLILLGCGTSFFSAQFSKNFFKELCQINYILCIDGADFNTNDIPLFGNTAIIFISQSGETKDLHRCFNIIKNKNIVTIGVVNVVDSMIAREVDCGVYLKAGREVAVASTKAFTSQVICLLLIAIWLAQNKNINKNLRFQYIESLRNISIDIEKTIKLSKKYIDKYISEIVNKNSLFILGKSYGESIAKEGALKIKEISYIHAEGYSTSSLKHGPFALLEQDFPTIIIAPDDIDFNKNNNAYHEILSRKANVIMITDKKIIDRKIIPIARNSKLTSLLSIIPLQLIAYKLSILKGLNPDFPKNLAKVVTVE